MLATPFLLQEASILEIIRITFKGGVKDKVFITLLAISILCFMVLVPATSSLSMRQVREVAVSMSLSIISFISLVLTIFLGVNLVYQDIERKVAQHVMSMPLSREAYILGKFFGLSAILGTGIAILSACSAAGIIIASKLYQSTIPMAWENFAAAVFFEFVTLVIIAAISILFSTLSTNLFLPLFATIGFYVIGNLSQTVMDYVQSSYGKTLPAVSIYLSKSAYYIFPNLSALDLKFNAIYSLPLSLDYMSTILAYAMVYIIMVLGLSLLVFRRREMA